MRRLVVPGLLAATMSALVALPAAAQPPTGSAHTCPPRYTPMTLPALLNQAQRLGIPEEQARALFELVNKNEDDWICQRKLPGEDTDVNFVDNQAVGRDY